jgi:ABC-type uncharacterized transport system auxiliary subunit
MIAALLLLSTGCVGALKSDYPERRYYTLAAEREGKAAAPTGNAVLRIRRFTASKTSEGNELVTRLSASEYETDFYSQFFAPPAQQLTEQAQRWLAGSGLFAAVVGTGSSLPETHVLEGNVIALYADGREKSHVATLELQFMLLRVSSDPTAVLLQKTYQAQEPRRDGAAQAVEGWNAGLRKILAELEADLAKVDRSVKK